MKQRQPKKNRNADQYVSELVHYFLSHPASKGARTYLRAHKEEFRQQIIEGLGQFYALIMWPPEKCQDIRLWEQLTDRILELNALRVFSVDQMTNIHAEACSDVYNGVIQSSKEYPEKENSKQFFDLYPEFFAKRPSPDLIFEAGLRARDKWEKAQLCEQESLLGAELRRLREEEDLGLPRKAPEARSNISDAA